MTGSFQLVIQVDLSVCIGVRIILYCVHVQVSHTAVGSIGILVGVSIHMLSVIT